MLELAKDLYRYYDTVLITSRCYNYTNKNLEMKTTMSQIKNTMDGINEQLGIAK